MKYVFPAHTSVIEQFFLRLKLLNFDVVEGKVVDGYFYTPKEIAGASKMQVFAFHAKDVLQGNNIASNWLLEKDTFKFPGVHVPVYDGHRVHTLENWEAYSPVKFAVCDKPTVFDDITTPIRFNDALLQLGDLTYSWKDWEKSQTVAYYLERHMDLSQSTMLAKGQMTAYVENIIDVLRQNALAILQTNS